MELQPVSRQKVYAILKKHHRPAEKVKDRINWHWRDGFQVVKQGETIEVRHRMDFHKPETAKAKAEEYRQTLLEAGVYAYASNAWLVVAGIKAAKESVDQSSFVGRLI